jgi:hypothetical protein
MIGRLSAAATLNAGSLSKLTNFRSLKMPAVPEIEISPFPPNWYVDVPMFYWGHASALLTTAELAITHRTNEGKAMKVFFHKEEDARVFTHILRGACSCLLAVHALEENIWLDGVDK